MLITDALKMWAAWHERYDLRLGYPCKSTGISTGGVTCWDDLAESVDGWMCGEIEAGVGDLEAIHPAQAAAINHNYLLAVYRFPRGNYPEMLSDGLDWLTGDLLRRGVYVEKLVASVRKIW